MFPHVLGQQPCRPQLLGIAQFLRFLAGQIDYPGFVFLTEARPSTSTRQILQGRPHTQLQSFGNAPFDFGTIGVQRCSDRRDGLSLGIAEENLGSLNTSHRLRSGLR